MTIEYKGYVVITFTSGRCEATDWPACPMSVEWFDMYEEADAYAGTLPEWTNPHIMPITKRERV